MQCHQVRANLVNYMAGEFQFFDVAKLEEHLSMCEGCRAELEDFQAVDRALCTIPFEPAPPGLLPAILERTTDSVTEGRYIFNKRYNSKAGFFRDLVAAAAAALAIFWAGGDLFNGNMADLACQKMDVAVQDYVNYSGEAVNSAYTKVGRISDQLIVKEWDGHEVRQP